MDLFTTPQGHLPHGGLPAAPTNTGCRQRAVPEKRPIWESDRPRFTSRLCPSRAVGSGPCSLTSWRLETLGILILQMRKLRRKLRNLLNSASLLNDRSGLRPHQSGFKAQTAGHTAPPQGCHPCGPPEEHILMECAYRDHDYQVTGSILNQYFRM